MDSSETRRVEALNDALDEAMSRRKGRVASDPRAEASDRTSPDPELARLLETATRLRGYRPAPRTSFDARMRRAIATWPAPDGVRAGGEDGSGATNASGTTAVAAAAARTIPDRRLRIARRLALRAAGVAAAVALTFGGLRAVSADSGPGDLLWPVQRAVRQVERVVSEAAAGLPGVLRLAERGPSGDGGSAAAGGGTTTPTATAVARTGDRGEELRGAKGEQRSAATRRDATSARATEAAARAGAIAFAARAATADAADAADAAR